MGERLYEFTEPVQPSTNTSSGPTLHLEWKWQTMTVHKPNPFHGWERPVFAFDEWAHRTLIPWPCHGQACEKGPRWHLHRYSLNTGGPLAWLCDVWDRHLLNTGEPPDA